MCLVSEMVPGWEVIITDWQGCCERLSAYVCRCKFRPVRLQVALGKREARVEVQALLCVVLLLASATWAVALALDGVDGKVAKLSTTLPSCEHLHVSSAPRRTKCCPDSLA